MTPTGRRHAGLHSRSPNAACQGSCTHFFRANQHTISAGAYLWDAHGDQPWNCRYAKNFWHLLFPKEPLSEVLLANGIRYRCVEPQPVFELGYDDPDGDDDVHIDLRFEAVARPNYFREHHLDQPGHYSGTIVAVLGVALVTVVALAFDWTAVELLLPQAEAVSPAMTSSMAPRRSGRLWSLIVLPRFPQLLSYRLSFNRNSHPTTRAGTEAEPFAR